jgi:V/A-type H+-transporting ATPase subunit E
MEDLQSLLEKINRDGVEKAEAKAREIVAEAEAKAAAIIAAAREEAEKTAREAAKKAEDSARRAAETIRQSARDTVIETHAAVTACLEKLLKAGVSAALDEEATVKSLAAGAIGSIAGGGEIRCPEKFARALAAELAGKGAFEVVSDETVGSGFSVRIDGGRIEHTFTAEAVSSELARRLRPDLAALVK